MNTDSTFLKLWLISALVIVAIMLWQIHHDAGRPFL